MGRCVGLRAVKWNDRVGWYLSVVLAAPICWLVMLVCLELVSVLVRRSAWFEMGRRRRLYGGRRRFLVSVSNFLCVVFCMVVVYVVAAMCICMWGNCVGVVLVLYGVE